MGSPELLSASPPLRACRRPRPRKALAQPPPCQPPYRTPAVWVPPSVVSRPQPPQDTRHTRTMLAKRTGPPFGCWEREASERKSSSYATREATAECCGGTLMSDSVPRPRRCLRRNLARCTEECSVLCLGSTAVLQEALHLERAETRSGDSDSQKRARDAPVLREWTALASAPRSPPHSPLRRLQERRRSGSRRRPRPGEPTPRHLPQSRPARLRRGSSCAKASNAHSHP